MCASLSCAGTIPREWLTSRPGPAYGYYMGMGFALHSEGLLNVSLNNNNMRGSIPNPDPAFQANLFISPMNAGFGLCGSVPDNIRAYSYTPFGEIVRLTGVLPSGVCTGVRCNTFSVCMLPSVCPLTCDVNEY